MLFELLRTKHNSLNMNKFIRFFFFLIMAGLGLLSFASCQNEKDLSTIDSKSKFYSDNVILVVIDGPRYSETFGDPSHQYVPYLADSLLPLGTFYDHFYNLGKTKTVAGHTAILTGVYQQMENTGQQYPRYPSVMQLYLEHSKDDPSSAWLVTSKQKLNVLADCGNMNYRNRYNPSVSARDRFDIETYEDALKVMDVYHPRLMMIHFRGPDWYGHHEQWNKYLGAIRETDSLLYQLWKHIEADPVYSGKTTLMMTNDHGRHLDNVKTGFTSHGDHCRGCTHISFFAIGPDIKEGAILSQKREQIDILPTVSRLMGFKVSHTDGDLITEMFNDEK